MDTSVSFLGVSNPTGLSVYDDHESRWLAGLTNKQLIRLWRALGTGSVYENGTEAIMMEMQARGFLAQYFDQGRSRR